MPELSKIIATLGGIAPLSLAESWDNVGLLLGDEEQQIDRVMTCLTVTQETVQEAIDTRVQLIVSHHPIPFKPVSRITTSSQTGRLLLRCAREGIAIYSPHTAWDNAVKGINWQLAQMIGLQRVSPISTGGATGGVVPTDMGTGPSDAEVLGQGRMGEFAGPTTLSELRSRLVEGLGEIQWRSTHCDSHRVEKVGIICGSGGGYWGEATKQGCDAFLTGEATYHQCLEAEANGVAILLVGHHASEFFAMKKLAAELAASHEALVVECSQRERSTF